MLTAGRTTVLPYTVWMPLLDTAHTVRIPSPTPGEVVVTAPAHSGARAASARRHGHSRRGGGRRPGADDHGDSARSAALRTTSIEVPVYFTIQPGGAYVHTYGSGTKGAWLIYPNGPKGWAGKRIPFYHYEPEEKDWYVYGLGTVTANRAHVVPDASTRLYEFGAMINMGWGPPGDTAPPGDEGCNDGDPVNLWTGLFDLEQDRCHPA